MDIDKKQVFDKVINWLIKGGFKIAEVDKFDSSIIEHYAIVTYHAEPGIILDLIFDKSYIESFIIKIKIESIKQINDSLNILNKNEIEKFYTNIQKLIYSFHCNYEEKNGTKYIIKTFYIENLNRQYFFDSIFDLVNLVKIIQINSSEFNGRSK